MSPDFLHLGAILVIALGGLVFFAYKIKEEIEYQRRH